MSDAGESSAARPDPVEPDGEWLNARRLRAYASLLLAMNVGVLGYTFATSDGLRDAAGRPLGTDFANVWSAGRLAVHGDATLAYDPAAQHAEQQRIFDDPDVPFYGWHYPPFFLAVAAVLAALPYLAAFAAWQTITTALYLASIRLVAPHPLALLLALAFPPVLVNWTHGQNGFLSAALLGGGLALLRSRPLGAGVLFGLLAYKPHLGVLLPFALLAGGHRRAFAAAAITVLAVAAGSWLALGADVWRAFFASTDFTTSVVLEAGGTAWHKQQSVFAWIRTLGGSVRLAYGAQLVLAAGCLAAVVWLWRSRAGFAVQAAGLAAAALLATPYAYDYDLLLLAPGIAFLGVHARETGFLPGERAVFAFVFLAPLFARVVGAHVPVPLGLLALLVWLGVALRRAAGETAAHVGPEPSSSSSSR